MSNLTPQELAQATFETMFANDHKAQEMGIKVTEIAPGYAKGEMTVTKSMLNGHGTTHGGSTFALADTIFAYACNTYNKVTVASGCDITYSGPSYEGDVLTAKARETILMGRSGIYDVTVTKQDGTVVALFRGRSRTISGEVI
ncbi:phenylacetate pathway hotdog-fold thioesterase [Candidatus Terasakiella magnetica]|uniref:Phenylacetate pathway hotdog-fold thioesterase n=1 Tax=Candidatus Terasakiella magnetica TaxID=1867952 RepID=A0A1C3RE04_9PROT|nr:hydroxyphenylacetyl-CoA thioesterase PaaI [Candidatus Terasakiella magnetica]SCA55499.1 phenylacetate pathway hotdog-fold thioesterase [Candidatus Terasakiella magnetica]